MRRVFAVASIAISSVSLFGQTPSVVSVTPQTSTQTTVNYTLSVSDPNGAASLKEVGLLVNRPVDPINGCYIKHVLGSNRIEVANDQNTATVPATLGSFNEMASNSFCSVRGSAVSTAWSGNTFILQLTVMFNPALAGIRDVSGMATNVRGLSTGWVIKGTLLVPNVDIAGISGLRNELDLRPMRGPTYFYGRAAIIGTSGSIEGAMGVGTDCVRVNGTSGPCSLYTRIDRFKVSSSTQTFTLTQYPAAQPLVYRNGVLMFVGEDYDNDGQTIRFRPGMIPDEGDLIQIVYGSQAAQ